ncbi:protein yellow-like [Nilaparvata lugens]|uniref:protein yellow-like n=1 Tax=Nilaparvata lugens TaxID=108931 RepID=UPI00193D0833|nr:protein yellow-like [Nilaparvata lugens]
MTDERTLTGPKSAHYAGLMRNGYRERLLGTAVVFPWLVSMWVVDNLQYSQQQSSSNENVANGSDGKFEEVYRWKEVDFVYPSPKARLNALATKAFIPKNNLPLGLEVTTDKVFVTLPRWKQGVPCSLAVLDRHDPNPSPRLRPFPSWKWHQLTSSRGSNKCDVITSVFRMSLDQCGRVWVLDSGSVDIFESVNQLCPPQILVFDVNSEKLRYGLVVYDWQNNKSWRISHPHFYPDPIVSRYDLDGIIFRWTDGIFGLALSPPDPKTQEKLLYFHPLSSFREFSVSTEILRNETKSTEELDCFNAIGQPRGRKDSHASASAMDSDGILYYNLVSKSAVGCWNSKNGPHLESTQGVIETNNTTLSFPNDLKIETNGNEKYIWVLSNRLHKYLYSSLSPDEYNFRILRVNAREAVKGTVCQPGARVGPTQPICYEF